MSSRDKNRWRIKNDRLSCFGETLSEAFCRCWDLLFNLSYIATTGSNNISLNDNLFLLHFLKFKSNFWTWKEEINLIHFYFILKQNWTELKMLYLYLFFIYLLGVLFNSILNFVSCLLFLLYYNIKKKSLCFSLNF